MLDCVQMFMNQSLIDVMVDTTECYSSIPVIMVLTFIQGDMVTWTPQFVVTLLYIFQSVQIRFGMRLVVGLVESRGCFVL